LRETTAGVIESELEPRSSGNRLANRIAGVGSGPAYFLEADTLPTVCLDNTPLTFEGVKVHRAPEGSTSNLNDWRGQGNDYRLSVAAGKVTAEGSTHGIY
jgi:hypothetical protein